MSFVLHLRQFYENVNDFRQKIAYEIIYFSKYDIWIYMVDPLPFKSQRLLRNSPRPGRLSLLGIWDDGAGGGSIQP